MPDDPDITVEPVAGLPEMLPEDEVILWQGRPGTWALARDALAIRWISAYFLLLALWRVGSAAADVPLVVALGAAVPPLVVGGIAFLNLLGIAWVLSRTTVYTVTSARVAMRIGAALTLTLNLPFREISSGDLDLRRDGTGTLAFKTLGDTRLSYFACWPHLRPWHMKYPEPALRCIPDAERVARVFAEAAQTRLAAPVLERNDAPHAVAAE